MYVCSYIFKHDVIYNTKYNSSFKSFREYHFFKIKKKVLFLVHNLYTMAIEVHTHVLLTIYYYNMPLTISDD